MYRLLDESELTDEELRENNALFRSSHSCAACQEHLIYTDEVFLLEVSEAVQVDGQIVFSPQLSTEGDYLFEPLLLHLECWEEIVEQIREMREDDPPVECENGILFCRECESTIGPQEPFINATFGEIQVSNRCPNGVVGDRFTPMAKPMHVCMACMVFVIEDYLDNWEDLLEALQIEVFED
jgi:hypothetical protein